MGVHGHGLSRWNTSVENSDPIVLEEDRVEPRSSDHGVEVIGPWPGGLTDGQWDGAFPFATISTILSWSFAILG